MCIMASPVESVSNTKIFVGHDNNGRQATVYSMAVGLVDRGKGNAMILPVPILSAQDRIDLVDLSGNPDFFEPLVDLFTVRSRSISFGADAPLDVVRVGSYDVSIVPTVDDVKRLNHDVFEVSADTEFTLRKNYPNGYVFLVAQLHTSGEFHPIAYIHPLVGGHLFVPTRHEHGQTDSEDLPDWDHQIFYQEGYVSVVMPQARWGMAFCQTMDVDYGSPIIRQLRSSLKPSAMSLAAFIYPDTPMSCIKAMGPLPNMDLAIRVT